MKSYDAVKRLLHPRVHPKLLEGYFTGFFNTGQDMLFAATYVDKFAAEDLEWLNYELRGNTVMSAPPKPMPEGPSKGNWQLHPPDPFDPKKYNAYAITFVGAYYQEQWYISPSLTCFRDLDETQAKAGIIRDDIFGHSVYQPYKQLPWVKIQMHRHEFEDAPFLVADIKQRKKENVNQAFRHYLDVSILDALAEKLRIYYPDKYDEINGLLASPHFACLFPEHKRFVLLATTAKGVYEETSTLRYLVYLPGENEFYEWVYFPRHTNTKGYPPQHLIDQLKNIYPLIDYCHFNASCTLDDDHFWKHYVFLQENGEYKYLRKLTFNGHNFL